MLTGKAPSLKARPSIDLIFPVRVALGLGSEETRDSAWVTRAPVGFDGFDKVGSGRIVLITVTFYARKVLGTRGVLQPTLLCHTTIAFLFFSPLPTLLYVLSSSSCAFTLSRTGEPRSHVDWTL